MKQPILFQVRLLQNSIIRNICSDMKEHHITSLPTLIQAEIIGYLINHSKEDIYQKDLESVFKLRRSTISGVLQTLERRGMITRVDSKNDGRVKKIILTEEAKSQHQTANEYLEKLENKITANILKEELQIFYKVVEQMKQNLEIK